MISCSAFLFLFFIVVQLSNATSVCRPKGSLCSDGYNKTCIDGTVYCNFMDIYSGSFLLTNDCVTANGEITPRVRIRGTDIYLNLEEGVYGGNDVFVMAGNGPSVHLIGDYKVDLFKQFNLWNETNSIYFKNETVFENHDWTIKYGFGEETLDFIFNKQATFNNFSLTVVASSKAVFKENVQFLTGSTLNLSSNTTLQSNKLFECEKSNVNIDSISLLSLDQTHIKSNSKWSIKGINTNSKCTNTIEVINSSVTFEDNSIMND